MKPPIVVKADTGILPMPSITVYFSDNPTVPVELFRYYPDEISFTEQELIGKTEREIRNLRQQKDIAWLQS